MSKRKRKKTKKEPILISYDVWFFKKVKAKEFEEWQKREVWLFFASNGLTKFEEVSSYDTFGCKY